MLKGGEQLRNAETFFFSRRVQEKQALNDCKASQLPSQVEIKRRRCRRNKQEKIK